MWLDDTFQDHVLLGIIRISPECNWPTMDQKIYAILEVCYCMLFEVLCLYLGCVHDLNAIWVLPISTYY